MVMLSYNAGQPCQSNSHMERVAIPLAPQRSSRGASCTRLYLDASQEFFTGKFDTSFAPTSCDTDPGPLGLCRAFFLMGEEKVLVSFVPRVAMAAVRGRPQAQRGLGDEVRLRKQDASVPCMKFWAARIVYALLLRV